MAAILIVTVIAQHYTTNKRQHGHTISYLIPKSIYGKLLMCQNYYVNALHVSTLSMVTRTLWYRDDHYLHNTNEETDTKMPRSFQKLDRLSSPPISSISRTMTTLTFPSWWHACILKPRSTLQIYFGNTRRKERDAALSSLKRWELWKHAIHCYFAKTWTSSTRNFMVLLGQLGPGQIKSDFSLAFLPHSIKFQNIWTA